MNKRGLVSFGVVCVIVLSGYFLTLNRRVHRYDLRFDKVSTGEVTAYVTATGTLSADTSVSVGTQVSGIVTNLYADFNSVVKAGQVIAKLDTTFLYQAVKDAEASLDGARAQYVNSERTYELQKRLQEKGLAPEAAFDSALVAYQSDGAALKQAEVALHEARINLGYATIRAPIDGIVVDRPINIGQTVAASYSSPTFFTIANDLSKMQVQATIDETDIGKVNVGQQVTLTVDAYDNERWTGLVSQIRLDPQSIQNVVNYIVIIDVNNDRLRLMPGMTANVKILIANARNAMKVSNMALRFEPPADIVDTTGIGLLKNQRTHKGVDTGFADARVANTDSVPGNTASSSQFTHRDAGNRLGARSSVQASAGQGRTRSDSMETVLDGRMIGRKSESDVSKLPPYVVLPDKPAYRITSSPGPSRATTQNSSSASLREYQKSMYNPSTDFGTGRVWILEPNGLLKAVFVRTGVNDGSFTAITAPQLHPGDQIVIGVSAKEESTTQPTNPLVSGR